MLFRSPRGTGPVVLELAVARARASLLGNAIAFDSTSRKLRYGELSATNASDVPIPAHVEVVSADRVGIVVDDARATYPITIAPTMMRRIRHRRLAAKFPANRALLSFPAHLRGRLALARLRTNINDVRL